MPEESLRSVASQVAVTGGSITFKDASDFVAFAQLMAKGGIALPPHLRNDPGACLAVVTQACEWGMSPFAVANKTYAVNDRLAYEAQLVAAIILRRAPIEGRIRYSHSGEGATRQCTATVTLAGGGGEISYTTPKLASISAKSPLWKSDPDQQLCYYAARSLCRREFPDVLLGVYGEDEYADAEPLTGAPAKIRLVEEDEPAIEPTLLADTSAPGVVLVSEQAEATAVTPVVTAASEPEPVTTVGPKPRELNPENPPEWMKLTRQPAPDLNDDWFALMEGEVGQERWRHVEIYSGEFQGRRLGDLKRSEHARARRSLLADYKPALACVAFVETTSRARSEATQPNVAGRAIGVAKSFESFYVWAQNEGHIGPVSVDELTSDEALRLPELYTTYITSL